MPRPASTDPLFAAIDAVRAVPPEPGEPRLRDLMQQAQDQGLPWHRAYAAVLLVTRNATRDDDEATQLAQAALAVFQAQDCAWGRCVALRAMGHLQMGAGQPVKALEFFQESVAMARRAGDLELLARCLHFTAFPLYILGQYETAVIVAEEACALSAGLDPAVRTSAGQNLAASLLELARRERTAGAPAAQWQGHAGRAAETMRAQVRGTLPDARELRGNAYSWGCLAAALVLLEQHDVARRIFALLLPHYVAAGDGHAQLFVQRHLGWSHLQCGHWEQALACAGSHHALVAALGRQSEEHRGLEIEALALEQAGRWQESLQTYKKFHASHARHVLEQAAEKARALAVAMQTDRALRESQLDALTDLANRRAFDAALARAVGQPTGEVHALMLIDMDHFKQVNDRHGHAAGDDALRALAAAMKRCCRSSDLPARLGGDEFAVLVSASTAAALRLAQRLRGELRQWRPATPGMASPTLSIGVAERMPGMVAADWLAAADEALYAAKAAGRDAVRAHGGQAGQPPVAPGAPDTPQSPGPTDAPQAVAAAQAVP